MARFSPFLPLIGGGKTRFQPVYVGDVADAAVAILDRPEDAPFTPAGKTYELAGPRIYSFKELLVLLLAEIDRKRILMPVPWGIARLQAAVLGLLPQPPLTLDQLKLLQRDNIASGQLPGFTELGIVPDGPEPSSPPISTASASVGASPGLRRAVRCFYSEITAASGFLPMALRAWGSASAGNLPVFLLLKAVWLIGAPNSFLRHGRAKSNPR